MPYLNGGIFQRHQIEELHGENIDIPDKAFEKLFDFFDAVPVAPRRASAARRQRDQPGRPRLHLREVHQPEADGRLLHEGGHHRVHHQEHGDSVPFDMAKEKCRVAFEGDGASGGCSRRTPTATSTRLLRKGRTWIHADNKGSGRVGLPSRWLTRCWRRVEYRRLATPCRPRHGARPSLDDNVTLWFPGISKAGVFPRLNSLITLNLDIRQFAQDVIQDCASPGPSPRFLARHRQAGPDKSNQEMVQGITVLDPACGSGAFLFAALNILEPLYDACLERMESFLAETGG